MISLGAGPDLLKIYKELKPEDLTSQMALIDPSLPGQRNKSLPWFWTINAPEDVEANDWMSECKFSSASTINLSDSHAKVFRVHGCVPRRSKIALKKKLYFLKQKWGGQSIISTINA